MRSCSWSGCLTLILVMLSTVNTQQERTTPSFEAPVIVRVTPFRLIAPPKVKSLYALAMEMEKYFMVRNCMCKLRK